MSLTPPLYSNSLTPEWHVEPLLTAYPDAAIAMDAHVMQIIEGTGNERVWLIEHPPLYTAGTSANAQDLITPERFPVFKSGRGGQYTYHGPRQRVVYPMLNLSKRGKDIRCYVNQLESWIIDTLASFNVHAGRRDKRIGVWVVKPDGSDAKIAAIGVRIRRWVSFHGLAINVNPDLSHFNGIVPCGIAEHGVTSLWDLGVKVSMEDVDAALLDHFKRRFGDINQS